MVAIAGEYRHLRQLVIGRKNLSGNQFSRPAVQPGGFPTGTSTNICPMCGGTRQVKFFAPRGCPPSGRCRWCR